MIKFFLFSLFTVCLYSQDVKPEPKSNDEIRGEQVNFENIKNILANDFLKESATVKQKQYKKIKKKRIRVDKNKYNYPNEQDFWRFLSEMWLIDNAQRLKWDIEKPDYAIEKSIETIFEKFGFYEKNFRLLLVNTSELTHLALPVDDDYLIFVISIPFMRTMDLTKREIAILILEDYLRMKKGYLKNYVTSEKLQKMIGSNFKGKQFDRSEIDEAIKRFNFFIFSKGFNFQQQFETTNNLSSILKSDLTIWNAYLSLLNKIDNLVKNNELYNNYTKIYPSPELQIKWILPKKEIL